MLTKKDILILLNDLNLDKSEYWVSSGAALVMHGIKTNTKDIDLGCTTHLFDELVSKGWNVNFTEDGFRYIKYNDSIEIFENWCVETIDIVNDLPVGSIESIRKQKINLGRDKDLSDIQLIDEFLLRSQFVNPEFKFFIAVKGLIFQGNQFLIVKRSDKSRGEKGFWELPGGRLEFGETPEIALHREISEEVNLDISIIKLLNSWIFMRDRYNQVVGLTFLCRYQAGEVRLSYEHEKYAWINKTEINDYNIYPAVAKELSNYNWLHIEQELKEV